MGILIATATQGAANAFIQVPLNTGLSAALANGYKINQITAEYPTARPTAVGVYEQEFAVCRSSQVAVPNLSNDDVLFRDKRGGEVLTGVGFTIDDNVIEWNPQSDIILIEEVIYISYKTLNQNGAGSLILRLDVSPVKVSTEKRIEILQSRIN